MYVVRRFGEDQRQRVGEVRQPDDGSARPAHRGLVPSDDSTRRVRRWRGYGYREVREMYLAETPKRFTQEFPPPERQPLPGEVRHRPITADLLARRESARVGLIVGPPWTNEFRRLMSDEVAMSHMRESLPIRWALASLVPRGRYGREARMFTLRVMTLYLVSNYEVGLIAAVLRTGLPRVVAELRRGARLISDLIGPLGPEFVIERPDVVAADLAERGFAEDLTAVQ